MHKKEPEDETKEVKQETTQDDDDQKDKKHHHKASKEDEKRKKMNKHKKKHQYFHLPLVTLVVIIAHLLQLRNLSFALISLESLGGDMKKEEQTLVVEEQSTDQPS